MKKWKKGPIILFLKKSTCQNYVFVDKNELKNVFKSSQFEFKNKPIGRKFGTEIFAKTFITENILLRINKISWFYKNKRILLFTKRKEYYFNEVFLKLNLILRHCDPFGTMTYIRQWSFVDHTPCGSTQHMFRPGFSLTLDSQRLFPKQAQYPFYVRQSYESKDVL